MKIKHLIGIIIAATAISACSDEMAHRGDNAPARQKGFLYFNFKEGSNWKDGNASTRSDVEAPIRFKNNLKDASPIFLHTKVEPTLPEVMKKEVAETRGQRITGDVFDSTNPNGHWNNFAVYGLNDKGEDVFGTASPFSFETISISDETNLIDGWYEKGYSEDKWGTGTTGTFYAYAPASISNANGLSVSMDGSVPTITYDVPLNVSQQIDLLTAMDDNVSKGEDIELPFDHVLSAIKFKIKGGAGHNKWLVGGVEYDVTVNSIKINDVYAYGKWPIATLTGSSVWNDLSTPKTFELDCVDMPWTSASSSGTDLMDDTNVFMMLPQTAPEGATVELVCTLTGSGTHNNESISMTAPINGKVWKPGYTYTYTISLSGFTYVFDYNEATTKNYKEGESARGAGYAGGDVPASSGAYEEDIFIRSYKIDENDVMTNVAWTPQYKETNATAVGTGSGGDVWKDGSNGWIHIFDRSTGSYVTEVTTTHGGANEDDVPNTKLFKIVIGSIMTPIIDLSEWNHDQTKRWTGRSTSNCYIVAGPGTYRIPLIYGNAYTNGNHNTSAYTTSNTGEHILTTFHNHNDANIQSPFINVDLGHKVTKACLIWEEGNGTNQTNRENMGADGTNNADATTGDDEKYGHKYNMGTVVKVIEAIDTYSEATDGYNTSNNGYQPFANYLQFEVSPDNFKYGNAVVGVLDDQNKIVWSWHIWITDPTLFLTEQPLTIDSHDVSFAGTNIGWVEGGQSVPAKKRTGEVRLVQKESGQEIYINATQIRSNGFTSYFTNVLYQWGRKDPMRGNVDSRDDNTNYGAPRGRAGKEPWRNMYGNLATVGTLIEQPNTIYGVSNGDLFTHTYYNSWATNLADTYQSMWGTWQFNGKTIYDPSPVGYCVPPSRYLITLAEGSLNPAHNYQSGFEEINSGASLPIICNYTWGGKTVKFYANGIRTTTAERGLKSRGYVVPSASDIGNGFYHTSTPYSRDECYQLHLYYYATIDTHTKVLGDQSEALSVFPVKWSGEAVNTQDPTN